MLELVKSKDIEKAMYLIDGTRLNVLVHWRNGGAYVCVKSNGRPAISGFVTMDSDSMEVAVHQVVTKVCSSSEEIATTWPDYRNIADKIMSEEYMPQDETVEEMVSA